LPQKRFPFGIALLLAAALLLGLMDMYAARAERLHAALAGYGHDCRRRRPSRAFHDVANAFTLRFKAFLVAFVPGGAYATELTARTA
jgi:hypothetical protein